MPVGIFRIKVSNSGTDRYWKYIADRSRWIQLATLDENDEKFHWRIDQVPGTTNLCTIRPADSLSIGFGASGPDNTGVYWGYGFAQGRPGDTTQWQIVGTHGGPYAKLKLNDSNGYVLDCRDNSASCVHLYRDQDVPDAGNQRWSFELIQNVNV